ncbi:MAG: hypothetical protein IJK98_07700, partial [Clostridia bacterium]|nr:hypothetical protein [Clostridia bacterium]
IAVAGTNTADFFTDYLSSEPTLADRIILSGKAEKRGSLSPADYVVNLSITAAEFYGTPYGVAISHAFYSGSDPSGEKLIYLAITNEYETSLREVRSLPGEEIPSLLSRCCGDLCTFISDIAGTDAGNREVSRVNEKSLTSQYKVIIALVAALVAGLVLFAGLFFTLHGYTLKTWAANAWSAVFPGSKPIFTSEAETTTGEVTESVVATTNKISLTSVTAQDTAAATTAGAASASRSSSSGSDSSGGSAATRAPTTAAPTTAAPTTAAPVTVPPTTAVAPPTSETPTTGAPVTEETPSGETPSEEPTQQSSGTENNEGSGEQEEGN